MAHSGGPLFWDLRAEGKWTLGSDYGSEATVFFLLFLVKVNKFCIDSYFYFMFFSLLFVLRTIPEALIGVF